MPDVVQVVEPVERVDWRMLRKLHDEQEEASRAQQAVQQLWAQQSNGEEEKKMKTLPGNDREYGLADLNAQLAALGPAPLHEELDREEAELNARIAALGEVVGSPAH